MRRSFTLAGAALAMLTVSIGGASAQQMQRVQVGILECRGGASIGFVVGSVTRAVSVSIESKRGSRLLV